MGTAMRFLLDTHALLWWWTNASELSPRVRELIQDETNEVLASAAVLGRLQPSTDFKN